MTAISATATADTGAAPRDAAPRQSVMRDRMFARYIGGQTVSQLGNYVWSVAVSWTAVHLGSPGTAGIVLTVSSLPRLVLLLLGGVVADRHDIRRLMIGSDVLRAAVTLAAAGIALVHTGIPLIVVLALAFGTVDAIFLPSAGAMQPRLLEPRQYASGSIVANVAGRLALSVGAPLGGVLVAFGGVPLALAVDSATFAVSVVTLAAVRPRPLPASPEKARAAFWADLRAGLRFLTRHPVLGPLTLAILLTTAGFVGPMNIGMAELAAHRGWGASGIGVMLVGFALGSAVGGLMMTRLHVRGGAGVWFTAIGAIQGAAVFATALAPSPAVGAIATAAAGLCGGPMAVISSVLSQTQTPDEFRGRVSSTTGLVVFGVMPLASAGTGFAVAALGATGAYTVCGAIEASALLTLLAPGLRRANLKPT